MSEIDVSTLTDDELAALLDRASTERETRARAANAPAQVTQIVAAAAELGVTPAVIRAAVEDGLTPEQVALMRDAQ